MKTAQTTGTSQITANEDQEDVQQHARRPEGLAATLGGRSDRRRGHPRFSPNAFTTKIVIGMIEIVSRITAIAEP